MATAAAAAAAVASTDTSNGDGPAEGQPSALAGAPSGSMPLGRFSVCVSMLEIYNEAVHDLLAPGGVSAVAKPLDVSGLGECQSAATHRLTPVRLTRQAILVMAFLSAACWP